MKVLIASASKHGSTAEIAQEIGRALERHGLEVHVKEPAAVTTIDGFDAVVLGSAVYSGHWLEPALTFAERFRSSLARKPSAKRTKPPGFAPISTPSSAPR